MTQVPGTAAIGAARLQRYYTPYEVAQHNTPHDCWVTFRGGVYDLTALVAENPGPLCMPIVTAAGQDITHWFDAEGEPRTHVDPTTNVPSPYCPQGRFVHVPEMQPGSSSTLVELPWWRDTQYRVGTLSQAVRLVRLRNMLTQQEDTLEVPGEETLGEIRRRYLAVNAHAGSYVWKALRPAGGGGGAATLGGQWGAAEGCGGAKLVAAAAADAAAGGAIAAATFQEVDLNQTLAGNGLADERSDFEAVGLAPDHYVPCLHLHFCDDLTLA